MERGGDRAAAGGSEGLRARPGQAGAPRPLPPMQPGQSPHSHPCQPSVLTLHGGPSGLAWEPWQVPTSRTGLRPFLNRNRVPQ